MTNIEQRFLEALKTNQHTIQLTTIDEVKELEDIIPRQPNSNPYFNFPIMLNGVNFLPPSNWDAQEYNNG